MGGTWTSLEQRAGLGEWTNWVEVSEPEWMTAELLAGFISQREGRPATAGFSTMRVEGKIVYGGCNMADVLRLIDVAVRQASEPNRCGYCGLQIPARSPSLDFCSQACQRDWSAKLADGLMPDGYRMIDVPPAEPDVRFPEANMLAAWYREEESWIPHAVLHAWERSFVLASAPHAQERECPIYNLGPLANGDMFTNGTPGAPVSSAT